MASHILWVNRIDHVRYLLWLNFQQETSIDYVVRNSLEQRRLQNQDNVWGKELWATESENGISSTGEKWVFSLEH